MSRSSLLNDNAAVISRAGAVTPDIQYGITIVADDLTGACDAGVAFLTSGRRVRVLLGDTRRGTAEEVCACTTESRNLPPQQAAQRVVDAITRLHMGNGILFKKVDSAARGPIAAEIHAALHASGAELALLAPAFPAAGRVVEDGVLRIRDASGSHQEVVLEDLFPEDGAAMAILGDGLEESLRAALEHEIARGTRILMCSARVQGHLDDLVSAALTVKASILWVGSAGLAHALSRQIAKASTGQREEPSSPCKGRTILFVGTPHPLTRLQMSHLDEAHLRIEVECGRTSQQEVCDAFATKPVAALILTGGDTAAFVLSSLRAQSLLLHGEIAKGVPWGFVVGGMADGCVVVTKSGGFGELSALRDAFEFCERRQHEST